MASAQSDEMLVESLLSKLKLKEKFLLLSGYFFFQTHTVPRLGIRTFKTTDGPLGISQHSSFLRKNTYFPAGINLAASWNRTLAYECGEAIGKEARAIKRLCVLGPGLNIGRTPFNGRTYEYYSEDPYLTKEMAIPFVKGVQSQKVAACPKHYVANNQETNRYTVSAEIDERTLQEIYLRAFKDIVQEADPWTIMTSYNMVNSEYVHESSKLLKETLIDKWGFNGFVMTDWWATAEGDSKKEEPSQSPPELAIKAGLSLEMPAGYLYELNRLKQAFRNKKFTEEEVDELIRRILHVYVKVGMFEKRKDLPKGERNTKKHQNLARRMSEEGIVLLKNSNNILPLDINKIKKIAVLGPNANKKFGKFLYGGAAAVTPPYEITALKGLKEKCEGKIQINTDPKNADCVILFMGLNHDSHKKLMSDEVGEDDIEFGNESEKMDRKRLSLSDSQIHLIQDTVKMNPKTIVVLINGSPVSMEEWINDVPAVLETWYPGMEGGRAISSVIFGVVNPSGKLPMTFPKNIKDSPAHKSERTFPGVDLKVHYEEGLYVGYRFFDKENIEPLFPFGYGLSYTKFNFDEVKVVNKSINTMEDEISITVTISNVGDRAGSEVVQAYAEDIECTVERAARELVGFEKIFLEPGETGTVEIKIKGKDLAFYDISKGDWNLEKGDFLIHIGNSSRDFFFKEKIAVK